MATKAMDLKSLRQAQERLKEQSFNTEPFYDESTTGSPITDSFFGINNDMSPLAVPINKTHYGYVFFTRPQLNLQTENLKNVRIFMPLLTNEPMSVHRAVRTYLDPRLQRYVNIVDVEGNRMGVECPLVDPFNPFISIMTNHITNLSGFPSKVLPVYTSPEGQFKESYHMVDGIADHNGTYTLSATFRNSKSAPIFRLIDYWTWYISHVAGTGNIVPYVDILRGGLIDYNTRIYHITLDPSKQYVEDIYCSGASTPISLPTDQQADYSIEKPYNDANAQFSVMFQSSGAWWNDEIAVYSFNRIQSAFHPGMRNDATREATMVKVPPAKIASFRCRCYPRIDPVTREMEWWVTKEYFQDIEARTGSVINDLMNYSTGEQPQEQPQQIQTFEQPQPSGLTA
jgi:hypothetical protein